jgi:hypothetical protein
MAYFNHAFTKVFVGTHPTQASVPTVSAGVDTGFLTDAGVPSVNFITNAAPYALGVGVFGFIDPATYLSVNAASAPVTSGSPLILASTSIYQQDKVGPFHGGYQETTKSKMINPKYVSRFYRVDPCVPNANVVHLGNTPYTDGLVPANPNCCHEFLCDETYFLRIDVKGSPELRYLSRNGYWTMDYYTGCCDPLALVPTPVDSTLVFIAWATQAIQNPIVGPFIQTVVYDESGIGWYAPGSNNVIGFNFGLNTSPGAGALAIVNPGSGYTNGTFFNVTFANTPGSGRVGVKATITVAGGVVTAVAVTNPGMNYKVGDILGQPLLEGGSGATVEVTSLIIPTWDNYVSPGHTAGKCAGMKITGAFVDTKFGDCTFYPSDYFEKEPVKIIASMVDETGDPCAFQALCFVEQCCPRQGMGFGDSVVKDLILSESYMQNYFYTGQDLRIREVTQGYDVTNVINRSSLYHRYFLLHSVPRFNNPSGMFDNDQYMIQVITNAPSVSFENFMGTWLTACSCGAKLEIQSCGAACPGTCPTITVSPVAGALPGGTVGGSYNQLLTPAGGAPAYAFEVTSGALPDGVTLNSVSGLISGTPTLAGVYTFTVTVADTNGCEVTIAYTLTIV